MRCSISGCQTQRALDLYFKSSDLVIQTIRQRTACSLTPAESVALSESTGQLLPGFLEIDDRRRFVDQSPCTFAVPNFGEGMRSQQNHVRRLCPR